MYYLLIRYVMTDYAENKIQIENLNYYSMQNN